MNDDIPTAALPRVEGIAALGALVGMSACLAALQALKDVSDPFLKASLITSIAVNYVRAFEPVCDHEENITRSFSTRLINGFDKDVHSGLSKLRNHYTAHAGHAVNDFEVSFNSTHAEAKFKSQESDGQLDVTFGLGSRARAALVIGFNPDDHSRIKTHFLAVKEAAGIRLISALLKHQDVFIQRFNNTGSFDHPKYGVGDKREIPQENLDEMSGSDWTTLFRFSEDDLIRSMPENLNDITVIFYDMHFRIYNEGDNRVSLQQLTRSAET